MGSDSPPFQLLLDSLLAISRLGDAAQLFPDSCYPALFSRRVGERFTDLLGRWPDSVHWTRGPSAEHGSSVSVFKLGFARPGLVQFWIPVGS
jgi:hypothetical protein